jgi:hypothetical protein
MLKERRLLMNTDYMKMLIGPDGFLTTALAEGEQVVLQVAGECMEPAVSHQASVQLERPKFFIPGDVVAFHCEHQHRLQVHRFLGYVRRRGSWKLMTMPDRGAKPDPLVDVSAILGRVIAQGGRIYRITPIARFEAIRRYALWCVRHIARCFIP